MELKAPCLVIARYILLRYLYKKVCGTSAGRLKKEMTTEETIVHLPPPPPRRSVILEPQDSSDVDVSRKTWQSCCFQCDREVVLYATKTFITITVLVFAMARVITNTDACKDMSFPTSLIGMIAGSVIEQGHARMLKK